MSRQPASEIGYPASEDAIRHSVLQQVEAAVATQAESIEGNSHDALLYESDLLDLAGDHTAPPDYIES